VSATAPATAPRTHLRLSGWVGAATSTDHKRIGLNLGLCSLAFFLLGGVFALLMHWLNVVSCCQNTANAISMTTLSRLPSTPSTVANTAPRGRMLASRRACRIADRASQHAPTPTTREKNTR